MSFSFNLSLSEFTIEIYTIIVMPFENKNSLDRNTTIFVLFSGSALVRVVKVSSLCEEQTGSSLGLLQQQCGRALVEAFRGAAGRTLVGCGRRCSEPESDRLE